MSKHGPKKLLVVTTYYYPHTGGVATHTYNLYRDIVKKYNYEVTIVSSQLENKLTDVADKKIEVQRLPYWFKLSNTPINPVWIWKIRKIIKNYQPDVICVHTPVPFMVDCAVFGAGAIPIIFKYHHVGSMMKGDWLIDWLLYLYEKTILPMLLKKSAVILTSSEFTRRTFFKKYLDKTSTITPGITIDRFKSSALCDENRLLFVSGNLDPSERYKGLDYLLKALLLVIQDFPDVVLTIVGDGGDREYYQKQVQDIGIAKHVRFTGKLLGNDLVKEFHNSRIFIVPSVIDSTPNVILEAMAAGLPVVASDTGGIPDVVDNGTTGILVPPKDSTSLAKAILNLLSDKELAKNMGSAGFEKVSKDYSWEKKAEQSVRVIEKALEGIR